MAADQTLHNNISLYIYIVDMYIFVYIQGVHGIHVCMYVVYLYLIYTVMHTHMIHMCCVLHGLCVCAS